MFFRDMGMDKELPIPVLNPLGEEVLDDIPRGIDLKEGPCVANLREQLILAVHQDDAPGVLQSIADGAEIPEMGEALCIAAHRGCVTVVRELVAVGMCVNVSCCHTGLTPLQLAAASGHFVVCELLLDATADVHTPKSGVTALTLARRMGHSDVEEVVERHALALLTTQCEEQAGQTPLALQSLVLPRVSPMLSEAVLKALPAPPGHEVPSSDMLRAVAPDGSAPTPWIRM